MKTGSRQKSTTTGSKRKVKVVITASDQQCNCLKYHTVLGLIDRNIIWYRIIQIEAQE